jgi:murein DD-endopeptidase MepM/ murein hydrolase activator NlpD
MIVSQRSKRFLRRVAIVTLLVSAAVGGSLAGRAYLVSIPGGKQHPSASPTVGLTPSTLLRTSPSTEFIPTKEGLRTSPSAEFILTKEGPGTDAHGTAPGATSTPQAQPSPARPTESSTRQSANADEPQVTPTPISRPTQVQPSPTPTPQRVVTYTVREGDSLWGIAARFGLDVDTLRWSNEDLARNPDLLSVGQELTILPVKGTYHTVQTGETVETIALAYGVTPTVIIDYPLNDLRPPHQVKEGQKLVIPGGRRELHWPQPDLSPGSPFAWPVVGQITQEYSEKHPALDLRAPYGSSVYAAQAGTVTHSGWARTGYGYTVILDHDEGMQSLYSHMKGTWVTVGQKVERGQLIGEVGSTGHSTGPHVHFELRIEGKRVDPSGYLPAAPPH